MKKALLMGTVAAVALTASSLLVAFTSAPAGANGKAPSTRGVSLFRQEGIRHLMNRGEGAGVARSSGLLTILNTFDAQLSSRTGAKSLSLEVYRDAEHLLALRLGGSVRSGARALALDWNKISYDLYQSAVERGVAITQLLAVIYNDVGNEQGLEMALRHDAGLPY